MLIQSAVEVRGDAGIEGVVSAPEDVEEPAGSLLFCSAFPARHAGNTNEPGRE